MQSILQQSFKKYCFKQTKNICNLSRYILNYHNNMYIYLKSAYHFLSANDSSNVRNSNLWNYFILHNAGESGIYVKIRVFVI